MMRFTMPRRKRKDLAKWVSHVVRNWPWYAIQGRIPTAIFAGKSILWYRWDNNEIVHRGYGP
jgi:hypothetical protein